MTTSSAETIFRGGTIVTMDDTRLAGLGLATPVVESAGARALAARLRRKSSPS